MSDDLLEIPGVLRGAPWARSGDIAYPRADPDNFDRLPIDTWGMAAVPAGVRLELQLEAGVTALEIDYTAATDELGYRGPGAGTTFSAWTADGEVASAAAVVGENTVRLELPGAEHVVVYLPEGMRPELHGVRAIGGGAGAPPVAPRWTCYGDSIAEGWIATGPAGSWPAIVARQFGLDLVNLGYAGSARGEIVSAEHVASLPADVISLSHGTNCWSRTPHSVDQVRANYDAFLTVVRAAHPSVPILVVSPVIRPDAEDVANQLGATLADLRGAIEDVVRERQSTDPALVLIEGRPLLEADDMADGVHPGDAGHETMAAAIGPQLAQLVGASGTGRP